jgi:hypothetical protein
MGEVPSTLILDVKSRAGRGGEGAAHRKIYERLACVVQGHENNGCTRP